MIEPLDTGAVRFYLQFEGEPPIEIAEPIRFDACNFVIQQDDKRMGRDVSFAGGKANLGFSPMVNFRGLTHQFDKLVSTYRTTGFESDVKFILEIEGETYVIGQLDFSDEDITDYRTYFDCKIIQSNKEALIKRRANIKVDLFSDKDLDGNPIAPLITENVYLRATPISQSSKWGMENDEPKTYPSPVSPSIFFNPAPMIKESGIDDTLSPSSQYIQLSDTESPVLEDYVILEAANTLKNCVLSLSGRWNFSNCIAFVLRIRKGIDFAMSTPVFEQDMVQVTNDFSMQLDIPVIERGERLYLYFNAQSINYSPSVFYEFNVSLNVNSVSLSSNIEAFNLGDAMAQVVRSISGLDMDAPRFHDQNGEFKKQYITDGLRIRNIIDQPFYLSLEDIEKYLPEIRGDYEVGEENVFFGIFKDFYRDEKIGEFDMYPNSKSNSGTNKEYAINTFEYKYDKYSSDNAADGSREAVHCSLQMMVPNKMVENKKNVSVGFVRDSFMLENNRRKAIQINRDTVTSDDGTVFIIDCVRALPYVEEALYLRHKVTGRGGSTRLSLTNDSSFNWEFMGVSEGIHFRIDGQENTGMYTVLNVTPTTLLLHSSNVTPEFEGIAFTKIAFTFASTTFVNRTDEGFDFLEGASTPKGFSNLLFTPKRNIYNYWSNYLLTAAMFQKDKDIKMTEFLYNRGLKTAAFGRPPFIVTEGKDISYDSLEQMEDVVLTPFLDDTEVICSFPDFWRLRGLVREKRGYIEIRANAGEMLRIYPKLLDFDWENNLLKIQGERKF